MVKKNIEYLGKIGKIWEVRSVILPEVLNNKETVDEVSKLIFLINKDIIYKLIKYRRIGVREKILKRELRGVETPSNKLMQELYGIARSNGIENIFIV